MADNQNSQTAGPGGPVLLQDQHLIEKLARFNRERIPERIVHAVGSGAHGTFEVTNPEVVRWTGRKTNGGASDEEERLVQNIAGSLAQVSRDEIIERSVGHSREANPEYGRRVEAEVKARRGRPAARQGGKTNEQ